MKTKSKLFVISLLLASLAGGSFLCAQSTTSTATPPAGTTPPAATGRGMGMRMGQPEMLRALLSLQEARRALEAAVPDKGGFREKAIASVDQAIKDVQAGIEYARQHPEEFGGRGMRGITSRGPRATAPGGTSAAPASSSSSS